MQVNCSINHTLMTIKFLQDSEHDIALIFSGDEHPTTESIIQKMSGVSVIGRINEEESFDKTVIKKYAELFYEELKTFVEA